MTASILDEAISPLGDLMARLAADASGTSALTLRGKADGTLCFAGRLEPTESHHRALARRCRIAQLEYLATRYLGSLATECQPIETVAWFPADPAKLTITLGGLRSFRGRIEEVLPRLARAIDRVRPFEAEPGCVLHYRIGRNHLRPAPEQRVAMPVGDAATAARLLHAELTDRPEPHAWSVVITAIARLLDREELAAINSALGCPR